MAKLRLQIPERTIALGRFADTGYRTKKLLEIGLAGVEGATVRSADFIKKFDENRNPPLSEVETMVFGNPIMKEVSQFSHQVLEDLPFHFHGMVLVSIWGAFETYLHDVFKAVFLCDPDLLKSDREIRFSEAVHARDDILSFLVSLELKHVMRLSFDDLKTYMKTKLKFQFEKSLFERLREIRSVRNVVAHSNGFLLRPNEFKLPTGLSVDLDKLHVTNEYLKEALNLTSKAALELDVIVVKKWPTIGVTPPRETAHLPTAPSPHPPG